MKTIDQFFPAFTNAQIVHDFFGWWPTLHDAEVIEILLDREFGFDFSGPKLRLTLYLPQGSKLVLLFENIELDYITDFNYQNAMADFLMETYDRLNQNRYRVKFGEFGAMVEFTCAKVSVLSIESFTPADYFGTEGKQKIEQES